MIPVRLKTPQVYFRSGSHTLKDDPVDVSWHDLLSVVILIVNWVVVDDVLTNLIRLGDSRGSPAHHHAVSCDVAEF